MLLGLKYLDQNFSNIYSWEVSWELASCSVKSLANREQTIASTPTVELKWFYDCLKFTMRSPMVSWHLYISNWGPINCTVIQSSLKTSSSSGIAGICSNATGFMLPHHPSIISWLMINHDCDCEEQFSDIWIKIKHIFNQENALYLYTGNVQLFFYLMLYICTWHFFILILTFLYSIHTINKAYPIDLFPKSVYAILRVFVTTEW